jgi:hypothetical protein
MTDASVGLHYLEEARRSLRAHKRLTEDALAQVSDDEFFRRIDPESNSIALAIKHIAGNMRSRWTDFLSSDGEKPDRNRDQEFEDARVSRADLMHSWENGWELLFNSITMLSPEDLERTVMIRGEAYSVLKALNVASMHYAYHIGQIVLLAKHFRGADWKSLSVPKPGREKFGNGGKR